MLLALMPLAEHFYKAITHSKYIKYLLFLLFASVLARKVIYYASLPLVCPTENLHTGFFDQDHFTSNYNYYQQIQFGLYILVSLTFIIVEKCQT